MNQFTNDVEAVEYLSKKIDQLKSEIKKVIVGHDEIVEHLIISILSKGHCLLIGVPGLAKTLLIKTLADGLDLSFNRIQFTPDLMPADITGTEILESEKDSNQRKFRFIKGPIFSNIILADEINRTPPKTQSALLEAMQEHQVTANGVRYNLLEPFFVLATQNPIEQEGTYPLPEAQLDRFMFNLWLNYPTIDEEVLIVKNTTSQYEGNVEKVFNGEDILYFQNLVKRVPIADNVIEYAVKLSQNSRPKDIDNKFIKDNVSWGAGPRASQYMVLAAKSITVINGNFSPTIDDIRKVAVPVLRHRIIPTFNAEAEGITSLDIINKLIEIT